MKRLLVLLFLSVPALTFADQLSEQVLGRMRAAMTQKKGYEAEFSVTAEGMENVFGTLKVFGDRYMIKVGEQEQFSDGEFSYGVNGLDKQVVIENLPEGGADIFTTPSRAFEFGAELFDMTYEGVFDANGHRCEKIVLKPKADSFNGINQIFLYVDRQKSVPRVISYDYNGAVLAVNIDEVEFSDEYDYDDFKFDRGKYFGYEIMDFR
ncbi:MAG: hypothetical protein IKM58_03630 [Tidjanibacter sp.]|nr:hypothetical protein [Tidjanibacter sp.]